MAVRMRRSEGTLIGFRPAGITARVMPALVAGAVIGTMNVLAQVSYAALIFQGDLAVFLSRGIVLGLTGSIIALVVTGAFSMMRGSIAVPQDTPVAVLAGIAAAAAAQLATAGTPEQTFVTVVAIVGIASLLTGLLFLGVGSLRLSRLIRYVPYPVIGGFLGGTGLILLRSSIDIMSGAPATVDQLLDAAVAVRYLPGVLLGIALTGLTRRFRHYAVLPAAIVVSIGLFYLALGLSRTPPAAAASAGWFLGAFPENSLWYPFLGRSLEAVRWDVVMSNAGTILTVPLVSILAVLLNLSGIELLARRELDIDQELGHSGAANVLGGLCGSPVSFHTLTFTALGLRAGANSRLLSLTAAVLTACALFFGVSMLSYFPRPVLGALVFLAGTGFVIEWLYATWFRLSRGDYALVLAIALVIAVFGFLPGVAVGVVAAVCLFVVNYSRIDVVHQALTGRSARSNVYRTDHEREWLRAHGGRTVVLKLEGYLFFGTVHALYERVGGILRESHAGSPRDAARFVVLDFQRVIGMDGSAESAFLKMLRLIAACDAILVCTSLKEGTKSRLSRVLTPHEAGDRVRFVSDLDHSLEWTENELLRELDRTPPAGDLTIRTLLHSILLDSEHVAAALPYLRRHDVGPGDVVVSQGEPSDCLYFVVAGEFSVRLEREGDRAIRLRTMGAGSVFGEIGLYLRVPRTVSVVARRESVYYTASREDLRTMERSHPQAAIAFQHYLIRLLSERMMDLNRTVDALSD